VGTRGRLTRARFRLHRRRWLTRTT
jgi:hypothetical protein